MRRDVKKRCPVCRKAFIATRAWQVYDRPVCRKADHQKRERARIREEVLAEVLAERAS